MVESSWCASVSALPFEVMFIPLAQGAVQMSGCMQRLAKRKGTDRENQRGEKQSSLARSPFGSGGRKGSESLSPIYQNINSPIRNERLSNLHLVTMTPE